MNFSVERKVAAGFAGVLFLLCVIGLVCGLSVAHWSGVSSDVRAAEERVVRLKALLEKWSQVELAEQAYQATGAEPFRVAHKEAVAEVEAGLQRLRALAAEDPAQLTRFDSFETLFRRSLLTSKEIVRVRSSTELKTAPPAAVDAQQKELYEPIRRAALAIQQADESYLDDRRLRAKASAETAKTVILVGGALAFVLAGLSWFYIRRDVTGRRRAEAMLRQINEQLEARVQERTAELTQSIKSLSESESRTAAIIGSAMDGIIAVNEQQEIVLFNAAAEQMFQRTAEEMLGQRLDQLIPERFRHSHSERVRGFGNSNLSRRGFGGGGAVYGLRANGEEFPIEASISQMTVNGQKFFTVILRDISERSRAEAVLRERVELEGRVSKIITSSPGVIYSFRLRPDGSMAIPFASPALEKFFGLKPAEVVEDASPVLKRIHAEDVERVLASIFASARDLTPWRQEFRVPRLTLQSSDSELTGNVERGTPDPDLWLEGHSIPEREADGGTLWYGLVSDITQRKAAEAALREGEERLQQVAASMRDALWLVDAQSQQVLYVNPAFERICGKSCDEFYRNPDTFNDLIHPDDKDRVLRAYFNGASVGAVEERHRIIRPEGMVRWVQGRTVAVRNAAGETYRIASIVEDITRRVEAERLQRSLEEQLRQAQKMEAIGTLAGGIAHDFNNVLAGILGSVELAQLELPREHGAQQFLQSILIASQRARGLVQQILTFSRRQESEKVLLQIQPVVSECVKLLRSTIPAMVRITHQVHRNCGPVLADLIQIHQVIMNICTNAWHALPAQNGVIDVTLLQEQVTETTADSHPDLQTGPYARLSITDNGHGMDAATQQRIFEPFFTTKPSGKGTGLGLSVVHGIIKSHKGAILVQSEPGKGTTFNVYLPVQAVMESESPAAPKELTQGRGERILFVDDEQNLAAVTEKVLTRIGYSVTRFTKSAEALECFQRKPDAFDLVITDLAMPGMSGTDLAAALLRLRGNIPILLVSGFVDPVVRETAEEMGIREVLLKPVSIEGLSEAVSRSLAGANGVGAG